MLQGKEKEEKDKEVLKNIIENKIKEIGRLNEEKKEMESLIQEC